MHTNVHECQQAEFESAAAVLYSLGMALTIKEDDLANAFVAHLQPGEPLRYFIYGQEIPAGKLVGVMLLCLIPAAAIAFPIFGTDNSTSMVMFFVIWPFIWMYPYMRIRKDYLLGVTDRRMLLIQIKTPLISFDLQKQVGAWQWGLAPPPALEINVGAIRSTVRLHDAAKPVFLKVPYAGQKGAKARVESLKAAFSAAPAPPPLA